MFCRSLVLLLRLVIVLICPSTYAIVLICPSTYAIVLICPSTYAIVLICPSTYAIVLICPSTYAIVLICPSTYAIVLICPSTYGFWLPLWYLQPFIGYMDYQIFRPPDSSYWLCWTISQRTIIRLDHKSENDIWQALC
jgi:hypothetical protein